MFLMTSRKGAKARGDILKLFRTLRALRLGGINLFVFVYFATARIIV
jgi:hypothetical protein